METIKRFQEIDPEKLNELCRMHLTFALDLHDDEFEALIEKTNDKKKPRGYFSRFTKDKSLTELMPLNQETISHIYQIIEFLGREINICREGLFRKNGSVVRQNELKTLLRAGENIDFSAEIFTAHDCACVLKSFLAELPEPLLSEAHYSAHCQITDMCQDIRSPRKKKAILDRQLKSTKLLLLLLPADNYCLLKYLLLLLNQIQNAQEFNKMSSENLATLFAPHIICPRKMDPEALKENFPRMIGCITFLIQNATILFDPPQELLDDVKMYLNDMSFEGQLQSTDTESTAVKTMITFCDRAPGAETVSTDYTNQALLDLQAYIEKLPNCSRKRKLMKKFQKENNISAVIEPQRKHTRSKSVGEALKKHLLRPEKANEYYSNAFNKNSTKSFEFPASPKAKSVETLHIESKESKFADIKKNFLRASRKKVQKMVKYETVL